MQELRCKRSSVLQFITNSNLKLAISSFRSLDILEIRATIPLQQNSDAKDKSLLLVMFDIGAGADFIMLKENLSFISDNREHFC